MTYSFPTPTSATQLVKEVKTRFYYVYPVP